MEPKNRKTNDNPDRNPPDQSTENKNIKAAHDQAEKDIEQDPDLGIHSPNDDLDEGESARLGEDRTDLV